MREIVAVVLYLCAAFLTFGHVFNANYVPPRDCGVRPHSIHEMDAYAVWSHCQFNMPRPTPAFVAGYPAFFLGVAWPVYWAGKAAIAITRPAAPVSREETIRQTSETIGVLFDEFLGVQP